MAKEKKPVCLYTVDEANKLIWLYRKDIANLTEEDNTTIKFYNTLGYKLDLREPEPKVRHTFKIANAEEYIKKSHKADLKTFNSFKAEAEKLSADYKELVAKKKAATTEAAKKDYEKQVKEVRNKQLQAQGKAAREQKAWFKDKYGEEVYNKIKNM